MTEEEVKEKWCPMGRALLNPIEKFSVNISYEGYGGTYCLGSYCMMWRRYSAHSNTGYCGLAGKPEYE